MVELLNLCISDDAGIRHIQIVETVLSHCPHVLWPNDMEKLKRAAAWAHRLRDCLRAHGFSLGSRSASIRSSVVSTPRRTGPNGLSSVGSVDCVNNNMPHKHARTSTQPPGLSATDAQDSAEGTLNIPAKSSSEKDNRAANTNLSPPSSGTTCKPANGSSASHTNCAHSRSADGKDRSPVPSEASFGELSKLGAHIMEADDFPLRTHRLSGGITNELFHVYDSEDPTTGLVIRVFGKETDRVISRESELFYQSLFIPTYVQGGNFLTYEFLVGYDTLPYTDMEAEWQAIADALAEFQVRATAASRVNIPVAERTVASCNSSEEDVFQLQCESVPHRSTKVTTGKEREEPDNRFDRETNYTICSLTEWVEQTKSEEIMEKVDASRRKEFASVAQHLERECTWMMEILKREEEHLGEGVCHNDLLSANIMRAENEDHSGPHLRIIDFDYTRRNYLLFDIANHFNEYTGLECDYARFFPSTEQMKDFIAAYRASMRSHLEAVAEANPDGVFPRERELFWTASPADEEVVVERWTGLVKLLTLSSHLSWAVWSLVQEAVSVLDVDFLEYAKLRLARYVETKEEFSAGY